MEKGKIKEYFDYMTLYHKKSSEWWQSLTVIEAIDMKVAIEVLWCNQTLLMRSHQHHMRPILIYQLQELSLCQKKLWFNQCCIHCPIFHLRWPMSTFFANTLYSDNANIHILLNYYFRFMLGNMSYSVLCPKGFCWVVQRLQQALQRYTGALHGLCTSQVNCNCLF